MKLFNIFATLFIVFSFQVKGQDCSHADISTLTNPGPSTNSSYLESDGVRNGPDYQGATIYYPTDISANLGSIVIVPGYQATQSSIQAWGPYYASHGYVAMTIGTNNLGDFPDKRAEALLDAIESLKLEHIRAASPLFNRLDTNSFAVSGWSMGGGGAQLAANEDSRLKAVVALCPWYPNSNTSTFYHNVPLLILSGQSDQVAPPASHADRHYANTPAGNVKLLYEATNGNHSVANTPSGAGNEIGKIALSWLKLYLSDDSCYCSTLFEELLPSSTNSSKIVTAISCAQLSIKELNQEEILISPNPANVVIQVNRANSEELNYKIINSKGKEILNASLQANQKQIDISGLQKGIYFLVTNKTSTKFQVN
jgi:dienelactone hydrolase